MEEELKLMAGGYYVSTSDVRPTCQWAIKEIEKLRKQVNPIFLDESWTENKDAN